MTDQVNGLRKRGVKASVITHQHKAVASTLKVVRPGSRCGFSLQEVGVVMQGSGCD